MGRKLTIATVSLTSLFFLAFFIWPIFESVRGALFDLDGNFTLEFIAEVWRNPIYREGLFNAFSLAVWSTLAAALLALPLAVIANNYEFPGKGLFGALVLIPMILPPFVGAIGIRAILGQHGALNTLLLDLGVLGERIDFLGSGRFWGVVAMNALHLYPILYLNVVAALANIDPALEDAAENLGCTGWRRFIRVTLPLMQPGLFAGGTIVFIWAFTELGVPLMFDYTRVTSVQIFSGLKQLSGNPFPFALVTVMLVATVFFYLVSKWTLGRHSAAMAGKATTSRSTRKLGAAGAFLCILLFSTISFLAMLPHIGVICVAFSSDWYNSVLPSGWTLTHFEAALGHSLTLPSIQNSLKYASLATILDLILGIAIAYVVVRTKAVGRQFLDTLSMLPLAVPGIVLAFGYLAMTQEGKLFEFLNPAIDPLAILVIAYSVRRLPYVVRSAVAGFQQTSQTLEEAAQNLGAPPFKALRKITLPLISANLIAGGLLAFSFAMLEVSDSLILAQRQQDYPITKAIYELYQLLGDGPFLASALGVWAMVFLGVTIIGASMLLGKRLGSLFRA